MEWLQQFALSATTAVVATFLLMLAFRRGWLHWGEGLHVEEVATLQQKIKEQDVQILKQEDQIRKLIEELLDERRKREALEKRIDELEREKRSRAGTKVLGIWPQQPQSGLLDLAGSRDAIYDAGFEHIPLFGPQANKVEILRQLRKRDIAVIEIGGHGTYDGVPLADGLARPGWWEQILRGREHVRIVLLLTCFSDQSMFDAVNRAGVPHIITVNGEIQDRSAVQFAQAFYGNYANGMSVAASVREAKLILDYTEAAKIELPKTIKG